MLLHITGKPDSKTSDFPLLPSRTTSVRLLVGLLETFVLLKIQFVVYELNLPERTLYACSFIKFQSGDTFYIATYFFVLFIACVLCVILYSTRKGAFFAAMNFLFTTFWTPGYYV